MSKTHAAPTEELARVGLRSIVRNPANPRAEVTPDSPGIAELAHSIDQVGLLQPLVVFPDEANDLTDRDSWRYVLVAGERRMVALRTLPRSRPVWSQGVPVVIRPDLASASKPTQAALIENLQRIDLAPLEEAEAFRTLKEDHGLSQAEIAEAVGKNQGYVSKRLALLKLLPELSDRLARGEIYLEQAVDAARLPRAAQEYVVSELGRGRPVTDAVREATRRSEMAVERGRLIRELKAAGVPVIDGAESPGAVAGGTQIGGNGLWWLDQADHASCDRRLVWFRAEPQTWQSTPAERWTIEYCLAEDAAALHPRDTSGDSVGAHRSEHVPPGADVDGGPSDYEARQAEREAATALADQDRAARWEFITTLLAGKLPKTAAAHLHRAFVADIVAGAEYWDVSGLTATAQALLGRGDVSDESGGVAEAVDLVDAGTGGDELLRWALAVRLAVDEELCRGILSYAPDVSAAAVGHLRFLVSAGYEPSEREAAFLEAAGDRPLLAAAVAQGALEVPDDVELDEDVPPDPVEPTEETDLEIMLGARARALDLAKGGSVTGAKELVDLDRDLAAAGVDVAALEQLPAPALPEDLHLRNRGELVELAKARGVETTPAMTKATIRAALERAAAATG